MYPEHNLESQYLFGEQAERKQSLSHQIEVSLASNKLLIKRVQWEEQELRGANKKDPRIDDKRAKNPGRVNIWEADEYWQKNRRGYWKR